MRMVIFVYGTTGELIKIAPVVNAIDKEKSLLINTLQQPKLLKKFCSATGFRDDDFVLTNGGKGRRDLQSIGDAAMWGLTLIRKSIAQRLVSKIKKISRQEPTIIIVHGDTMTTVIGAVLAKLSGVPFAHVEAGLRSGSWKHPFPEELDRRIVARLAGSKDMHFPPADHAERALKKEKVKGTIVNTKVNTVADSARWASAIKHKTKLKLPKKYILISVHRNEFLVQSKMVEEFCKVVNDIADKTPVIFLDHPITKARLTELGLDKMLKNVTRIPKLDYVEMMTALGGCTGIITDSGGLQEEAYYVGKPCIVFREHTERDEGIGENVVLSGINPAKLHSLVSGGYFNKEFKAKKYVSATKVIIETFKKNDYL